MATVAAAARPRSVPLDRPWAWLLLGGLVAGSLDLLFAMAWWAPLGASPGRILQSIAAWGVGREAAFAGGAATQALGAGLHYALTTAAVALYAALARRHAAVRRRPYAAGALYGASVFALLHLIVVPLLSAAPPREFRPDWMSACLLAHMLLLGVPAALFAERARHAGTR
ncbi:hypothetical protein [Vulcaniibacterium tengchongense]|uniref:DUF1440 domain-containing protein n=1 Tax=Vulcaniibacterium tengchongense TaxID=1273429 RepID=A0A3N4UXS8_9GAMM|nr:hypothetical protein [Vulcaniibacterium tengchongense]RPE75522.1 hypothetical protein EDC50_2967 [Vulcaniibacterium tengchongense]